MISTNFLSGQGLGNQLWVYAACRGIAARLKMPFSIGGRDCFKGSGFLNIDWTDKNKKVLPDAASEGKNVIIFRERLYYDPDLDYFASDYDPRVEHLGPDTHLEGLFQSEEYFYGQDSALGQWLRLSDEMLEKANKYRNLCVLNIRGGEYKRHKNLILPQSYWINGMKNARKKIGIDQFLIVTDDRAYGKALFPDIPILEGGVADCYAALHGARCHVVSNSSFSYFPIKTRADNPYVIAPYLWSRFANPYERWAAPANLYKNWHWQDEEGVIKAYDDCLTIKNKTEEFYFDSYNILTAHSGLRSTNLMANVPRWVKKPVKAVLSRIFPRVIG